MIDDIPSHISIIFLLICVVTLYIFLKLIMAPLLSSSRAKLAWLLSIGIIVWLGAQAFLSLNHFYLESFTMPPRALLVLLPWVLVLAGVMFYCWRSAYFQNLSLERMTYLHAFRFPLELFVLSGLGAAAYIPNEMTYEGRNFDIVVGLSAPLIAYLYFSKKIISANALLIWNVVSLLFLLNVTTHAVLAMPYPYQIVALDQPNIGVFYFPFIWLPALLVPIAYFLHIVAIHKILVFKNTAQ